VKCDFGSQEEYLLIAAWRKRQSIEIRKFLALATAASNPKKAAETFEEIVSMEFPEVVENKKNKEEMQIETLKDEANYFFRLSQGKRGVEAVKEKLR